MVSHGPMFVDLDGSGNGMTALDGRRALAGLFGVSTRPLAALPSATQSSSNMQITVTQNVWQTPDVSDAAATFIGALDAFVVTPAAGPGTGQRIDSIVLKPDNPKNSDTDPYLTPSLIAGTTVPPTVSAPYYEIARVTVPAGASNAALCTVQFLQPTARMPFTQQVQSAAGLPTATVVDQRATIAGVQWRWNGTKWMPWESDWVNYGTAGNYTVGGTGTNQASYRWTGGDLLVRLKIGFSSSSPAFPTELQATLPTLPTGVTLAEGNYFVAGVGSFQRSGTGIFDLRVSMNSSQLVVAPKNVVTANGASQVRDGATWPVTTPSQSDTLFAEIRLQVS